MINNAEGRARNQGSHLVAVLGVVGQDEDAALGQQAVIEAGDLLGIVREFLLRLQRKDNAGHGVFGRNGVGIESTQVEQDLPVGIVVADFAPDVVGQLGLADAALPVDGGNGGRFAVAQPCDEFVDVVLPPSEIGDGAGEQGDGGLDFRWFFVERLASFLDRQGRVSLGRNAVPKTADLGA